MEYQPTPWITPTNSSEEIDLLIQLCQAGISLVPNIYINESIAYQIDDDGNHTLLDYDQLHQMVDTLVKESCTLNEELSLPPVIDLRSTTNNLDYIDRESDWTQADSSSDTDTYSYISGTNLEISFDFVESDTDSISIISSNDLDFELIKTDI